MKKSIKIFLMTLLSVLLVISSVGLVACNNGEEGTKYGFTDKLASSYLIDEPVDIEQAIELPTGKKFSMTAKYTLNGQVKEYMCIGLTFKPTHLGEVKITVNCDGKDYVSSVMIIEQPPTLINVETAQYVLGETVELTSIASKVTIVPFEVKASVSKVRYAGGEEQSLEGETEYTFNSIGNYEFYFEASNSSGKVDGYVTAVVSREITANEVNDLTNGIKKMDYSTIVQSEEHSENSDWSWKVSATPEGTYDNNGNRKYWLSRAYIDFGQVIDLSKQYFEMDVWASENTYEGGVLIYYSPGSSSQLDWHVCPTTTYNNWQTISTQSDEIRNNPNKTSIKVRGIIISVLHRQVGEYDKENVYYLFDNLVVKEYRELGANEVNDLTNKGSSGSTMGMTYRLDETEKTANSDWSYKLYTKLPRKASDYPYVDLSLGGGNKSMSEYDFSFFVKTNAAYNVSEFKIVTLYYKGNNELTWGTEYTMAIEANSWNYISSLNFNVKEENVCAVRIQFNAATTDVRDIMMWVDNFKLIEKTAAETKDFANSMSVNSRNQISYGMTADKNGNESGWAWDVTGTHFDYFKVTFDKTYSFANAYFNMDIKPVANFGGKVVVQFIAEDGSVKKDWVFDNVSKNNAYVTLSTEADTTELLANYKAANIYLLAEDVSEEVNVIIDNVNVVSRGYTEYIAVDADDWNIVNGTGKKEITLKSFNAGEKYVQYYKEGGYTNEFIDVEIPLNGTKNSDWAFGMRVENVYRYVNVYGKQGFYIRLNDGFFTLYGPTYLGAHCGSYNYPNGMENCTTLRMGVISNNNYVQAFLYFMKADGTVIGTYTWKNMNTTSGPNSGEPINPELVKSGSFIVYSLKGEQTEMTVSDPFNFVPAPKLETDTEKVTFSGHEFADKVMYRVNGGSWTELDGSTYKPTTYGKFIVEAKSVIGTVESEISKTELIRLENPIEFVNLSNIEFAEAPTHQSGEISYSTPGVHRTGEGLISLKGDFTNQMIKVGFTATSENIKEAKLSIGLRESIGALNAPNYGDEIRANTFRIANFDFGTAYTALCCYETNYYSDHGGAKHELDLYKSTSFTGWKSLTVGNKYYMAAGMYTGNGVTYAYYALLDSNSTPLRIIRWDVDAIASALNVTIPTSGYFNIYTYKTTDSISYQIVDAETIVGAYDKVVISQGATPAQVKWTNIPWVDGYKVQINGGAWTDVLKATTYSVTSSGVYSLNVKGYKGTVETAIVNYTITNVSDEIAFKGMTNVTSTELSYEKGNVTFETAGAYRNGEGVMTLKKQYTNEFIKVGFTADSTDYNLCNITIGMRENAASFAIDSSATNADEVAHKAFRLSSFSFDSATTYISLSYYDKNFYSNHGGSKHETNVYTKSGFKLKSGLTIGDTYYIVAGMTTENDTTKAHWMLLDKNNEALMVVTWDVDAIESALNISAAESGWFTIFSYRESATITYEIISESTAYGYVSA